MTLHTHSHTHTHTITHIHNNIKTHTHTHTRTHTLTHTYTHTHTLTHTHTHTHIHTHSLTHTHTHTLSHIHTLSHTHTHIQRERDIYLERGNTRTEFFYNKRSRRKKLQTQNIVRRLTIRTAALYCMYVRQRVVYAQMLLFLYKYVVAISVYKRWR
jgi:hypothetical protein